MKAGVPRFNGSRLTQAREGMGLSMTSLADLIGVSKQAVSQYEKGVDSPGPEVFDRIRNTLKHEAYFFLTPPMFEAGTSFYRSMASTTKTARGKAEVWQGWVREIVAYLRQYVEIPAVNFPSFDVPADPLQLSMDRIEELAGELRLFWNLDDKPIANLVTVAEANGAIILRHTLDAETLDALSQWTMPEDTPLVVLNADKNIAVRSRLDLAHEIGHLVLHRQVFAEQLRKPELFHLIEDQAFRFGAALLLPEQSFAEDLYAASLDGLRALKPKWKVSVAMMIERLKYLGLLDSERYRRLRINYSTRQWNRQEPLDSEIEVERPRLLEKMVRLVLDTKLQTAEQMVVNSGFSRVWLERLLGTPAELLSPSLPQVNLKVLPFKGRA